MTQNNKKLIILKKDLEEGEKPGNLCYVKYLDADKNYAVFYKPLIAPKYFKHYLEENKIQEAFELTSDEDVLKYKDSIYTFTSENGVYLVKKGVTARKKLVLLVDKGMEIELSLPKYLYEMENKRIIIKPYNKNKNKDYCYVADEEEVNDYIKSAMIETSEVVPGILLLGEYELSGKTKKIGEVW